MNNRTTKVLARVVLALVLAIGISHGVWAEIYYLPISEPGVIPSVTITYNDLINDPTYSTGDLAFTSSVQTLNNPLTVRNISLLNNGGLDIQEKLTLSGSLTSDSGNVSLGFTTGVPRPVPPPPGQSLLTAESISVLGGSLVSLGFGPRTPGPLPPPPGNEGRDMLISSEGSIDVKGSTVSIVFGAKPKPLPPPPGNEWYSSLISGVFFDDEDTIFWGKGLGDQLSAMPDPLPAPGSFQIYDLAYIESSSFSLENSVLNFDLNELNAAYGDVFLLGHADSISFSNVQTNLPEGWGFFSAPYNSVLWGIMPLSPNAPNVVPEPSSFLLLGVGLVSLVGFLSKRRKMITN